MREKMFTCSKRQVNCFYLLLVSVENELKQKKQERKEKSSYKYQYMCSYFKRFSERETEMTRTSRKAREMKAGIYSRKHLCIAG